jgi:hypothetical protein
VSIVADKIQGSRHCKNYLEDGIKFEKKRGGGNGDKISPGQKSDFEDCRRKSGTNGHLSIFTVKGKIKLVKISTCLIVHPEIISFGV